MAKYSYNATNLLTGQLIASNLPLTVQSFGRTVNMTGGFTGSLPLTQNVPYILMQAWTEALEPWKTVLWALQDGTPVWNGPVTGQPHQSVLDGTLPVAAGTMEALFQCREIDDTIEFVDEDVFSIFRGLARYAVEREYGQVAGLQLGTYLSGVTDTVTFDGSQQQKVYDAWTWLVGTYGIEYSFRPALTDSGTLVTYLDLGYPQIGRTQTASGLQAVFPSPQVFDYAYPRVAQTGPANSVSATVSTASRTYTSQPPHGVVSSELQEGYPLLQDSASLTGLTVASQAIVNAFADSAAAVESISAMTTPVVKLGADGTPKVREVELGDEMEFAATSPLHPAVPGTNAPGLQIQGRITSWTLYPPGDTQQEATWYTLGQVQPAA